ncbi:hypothetical protein MBLNU13_g05780t1 [Cladosporium sp. NU13]
MRFRSILIPLATLLRVGFAAHDQQPGIGISLSSGYASVSAFLPSGSYIDIAKVEGDATYKAYMLGLREEPTKIASARHCPFSQRICQHWPFKSVHDQNPLAPLLKALVASAELTLETTVNSVAVSAYDIGTIDHQLAKNDIHTALNDLKVDSYNRLDHIIRHLAPVLGLQGNCSEPYTLPDDPAYHHDPEQLFFAFDRLNSAQFGHNAMQACRDAEESRWTCDEDLKSALRGVSADSSRGARHELGRVLLFGESALDGATLVALRQVLEEQFPNGDSVDWSRVQDFSQDLAFAGSRAMARTDWTARGSGLEDDYKKEL